MRVKLNLQSSRIRILWLGLILAPIITSGQLKVSVFGGALTNNLARNDDEKANYLMLENYGPSGRGGHFGIEIEKKFSSFSVLIKPAFINHNVRLTRFQQRSSGRFAIIKNRLIYRGVEVPLVLSKSLDINDHSNFNIFVGPQIQSFLLAKVQWDIEFSPVIDSSDAFSNGPNFEEVGEWKIIPYATSGFSYSYAFKNSAELSLGVTYNLSFRRLPSVPENNNYWGIPIRARMNYSSVDVGYKFRKKKK